MIPVPLLKIFQDVFVAEIIWGLLPEILLWQSLSLLLVSSLVIAIKLNLLRSSIEIFQDNEAFRSVTEYMRLRIGDR